MDRRTAEGSRLTTNTRRPKGPSDSGGDGSDSGDEEGWVAHTRCHAAAVSLLLSLRAPQAPRAQAQARALPNIFISYA